MVPCTLLMANAVMMSDSLWMMRAFPPGEPRSDSICADQQTHKRTSHHSITKYENATAFAAEKRHEP